MRNANERLPKRHLYYPLRPESLPRRPRYGLRRILKPKAISEKIEAVEMEVRVGTISGCSQNTIQDMKTISDIGRSKVSRKYCASSNPSP